MNSLYFNNYLFSTYLRRHKETTLLVQKLLLLHDVSLHDGVDHGSPQFSVLCSTFVCLLNFTLLTFIYVVTSIFTRRNGYSTRSNLMKNVDIVKNSPLFITSDHGMRHPCCWCVRTSGEPSWSLSHIVPWKINPLSFNPTGHIRTTTQSANRRQTKSISWLTVP